MASRFPPRERSPHRYNDRRPSAAHGSSHIPSGPRASDDVNSTPLGREPPRGPKALIDSSRGGPFVPPGPRGRGYPARGEFRDRERDRDIRDLRDGVPLFRRDIDREWSRRDRSFDSRDSRATFGRGRSRSPPLRDFRDSREPGPRDSDPPRLRRNSRDGPAGLVSGVQDASPLRGPPLRGRGRGDRDRGRGRGFLDDRDSFRRRSRSRDAWRDRERDRDRDRDLERPDRFDRRDDDRRSERDDRERERLSERSDLWKKDRLSSRIELKSASTISTTVPPISPTPSSSSIPNAKKTINSEIHGTYRKSVVPAQNIRDSCEDKDHNEYHPASRFDAQKNRAVSQNSPPPSAPEVPAFRSLGSPKPGAADLPSISTTKTKPPEEPAGSGSPIGKPEKVHNDGPVATVLSTPTGPKADRSDHEYSHDQRIFRPPSQDFRNKNEVPFRSGRNLPSSSKSPTITTYDVFGSTGSSGGGDTVTPSVPSDAKAQEIPLSARIGPRPSSSSGSPPSSQSMGRGISLSRRSGSPPAPPSGPFRSPGPKTSPGLSFASVPTGPRALQRPNAPRGTPKASNQWVRPGYANRGPSIMNSAFPMKRDPFEDKDKLSLGVSEVYRPYQADGSPQQEDSKSLLAAERVDHSLDQSQDIVDEANAKVHAEDQRPPTTISSMGEQVATPLMFGQSSGEETDEDDLDEEDFNEGEERFEKEMQALASEMPPPTLKDPVIVDLLLKIQMLGIIAEAAVPTDLDVPDAAMENEGPEQPLAAIPLPAKDYQDIQQPEQSSTVAKAQPGASLEAPTIENLPFLNSGPPTPFSDLEAYQETLQTHDRLKEALRGELVKQRKEIARQREKLRQEYAGYYKPWRITVEELDRKNAQEKMTTPGPPTPPSGAGAATTPSTAGEGRRGYKLNSELDFQNALIASTITAQEEQARRRMKEGSAKPDMSKEALIPDMFEEQEKQAFVFKDTNHAVDPSSAFEVFAFYPAPVNFTPEEQKVFTEAFLAHPKKWGKIAESLPGRDFQACINHYYVTKHEYKYKAKLNRKTIRRRQKKSTAATRNSKSNALMSDLGVRPEYEGEEAEIPAVTDTGRPRRAAAPTFGEVGPDTENSTPTPSSGKRGNNTKESGEQTVEKSVSRRGGRGGGGRGGRRAKVPQSTLTTPIAAAPPKVEPELPVDATPELPVTKEMEEQKDAADASILRTKTAKPRTKEAAYVFDVAEPETPARTAEPKSGSLQPTSYWSVPEQREFPELIRHFGKDFDAISQYMKTKTPTMVKNYFQRRVDSGQTSLEEYAELAEAKKLSGELPGPLPLPSIPPKRRYEATPSSVTPRPLAPNTEVSEMVDTSLASKSKAPAVTLAAAQPSTSQPQPRSQSEKDRPQPRFYPLAQATTAPLQAMNEEPQPRSIRPQPPQNQRNQQGPRAGYFSDDRKDARTVMPITPVPNLQSQEPQCQKLQQNVVPMQNAGRGSALHVQSLSHEDLQALSQENHDSLRYQSLTQPAGFSQTQYLQQSQAQAHSPVMSVARTHSRRSSKVVSTPTTVSPVQRMPKQGLDSAAPLRNDLGQQKSALPPPGHLLGIGRQSPVMSPSKEDARPNSTSSIAFQDPPRQVPAKRSNIMNILNDDAEEPQPRKRFASNQPSPSNTPQLYSTSHSLSLQAQPVSQDESLHSTRQPQQHRSQYLPQHPQGSQANQLSTVPSCSYPEYSSYSAGSMAGSGTTVQDWMSRLDPRGQQQSQTSGDTEHGISRLSAQQNSSVGYMNTGQQPTVNPGSNVHQQTQQQHHPSYHSQPLQQSQQSQPAPFQAQSQCQPNIGLGKRDSPMTLHAQPLHPPSPQHRHSALSYSRRSSQQHPASPVQLPTPGLSQTQQLPSYSQGHLGQPHLRQHHPPTGQLGHNHQHNAQTGGNSQHMQHMGPPSSPRHHNAQLRQSQQQQQQQPRHGQHQHQSHQHMPPLSVGSQQSGGPFGHNVPAHSQPRRAPGNSSIAAPSPHQNPNIGRPYTPPALHQPSQGGITYTAVGVAPHPNPGSQQQGLLPMHQHQHQHSSQHKHPSQHQLHSRHPGSAHHRAYSRDSRP
ncbi:uncharacterized protein PADG_02396 [Paracoccidioides brasiliensis Pb18]|uniref:SANT domain-containing protein n=1 Tax=Paracoccidioides brasiliensis (strain Pb18) TaxID=502780 RepID=C1G5E1_PARBD|nr:uncharacterized protein PADG_02396 [Paracoccidioides brasiliensis Pb18]EEH46298.2 hypothetical protein PADG_02396 [Paracoccidioides brasiliensis Pb18]